MRRPVLVGLLVGACWAVTSGGSTTEAQAEPYGWLERFALADDRAAALDELIPGTAEEAYWRCLHLQDTGALDEVGPVLQRWITRHGSDERSEQIEIRQALLAYERDPAATQAFLRDRLGLRFDHQQELPGSQPDLPSRLDPALISWQALSARALAAGRQSLDGFTDRALPALLRSDLDDDQLMAVLRRLRRPDHANLPALVVRNLDHRQSGGFGSRDLHGLLLLEQLEECLALRPSLLDDPAFVDVYLARLQPGADEDTESDSSAREAWLDRLLAFTARLSPAHNSLKAHVLYHRLVHDHALGLHDKQRFLQYLRLPHGASWVKPAPLGSRLDVGATVQPGRSFHASGLPPIGDDDEIVRAYFRHFFATEDDTRPYAEFVRDDVLVHLLAETRLLAGGGDRERWYTLLDDPAWLAALEQRVDIEFAPTRQRFHGVNDEVTLDVDLKHVPKLIVKVFEIDTFNYHAEQGQEVSASIDLDGLVANQETVHAYPHAPLQRHRERFTFPQMQGPGTWIVELIGNGISSRAVVQKGRLFASERVGAAGHVVRVLDETGRHLTDASLWLAGSEHRTDEQGEIVIPFTSEQTSQTVVLRHGARSSPYRFTHLAESYALDAAIVLERESLLAGRTAKLLVRPHLAASGRRASLALLQEPVLSITAVDRDGVTTTQAVRDLVLAEDKETVHEIQVPEGLVRLVVSLSGTVPRLTGGEPDRLQSPARTFELNGITTTADTSCPLLGRTAEGYVLDVLGRNGEPVAGQVVTLELVHRDFTEPVSVTLQTDAAGRIHLGALDGIDSVRAPVRLGTWTLRDDARTLPHRLCAAEGQELRVPYQGPARRLDRSVASLLERRGDVFVHDRLSHVALEGGFLVLRGLPAGDYDLYLEEFEHRVAVKVTAGEVQGDWIAGRQRLLPAEPGTLLAITSIAVAGDQLAVTLANAGADARVHLLASRYLPAYDRFEQALVPEEPGPAIVALGRPESEYHAGREIGDEYRYILERRYAPKFPGNMLRRPGLLLNPWALDETVSASEAVGTAAGKVGMRGKSAGMPHDGSARGGSSRTGPRPGTFPDLEFLPEPARVLANLRPGPDGVVRVPLADLGPGQHVAVLAVDAESTVLASHVLPERPLVPRDRRLLAALDPERHVTEQRRIELLDAGASAVIEDVTTSTLAPIDSLAAVFRLYRTLSGDSELDTFAFLPRWPELPRDEQLDLYSRHACHELHVFLHEKDPAFFEEVVRPYLANKLHKTFLDHWLLDADLTAYLEPWAYRRLNVVERILLGRRLPGEADAAARNLRDQLELLPPDPDRDQRLFETLLRGSSLDAASGLVAELAEQLEALGYVDADEPAPTPPASRDDSGQDAAEPGVNAGEVEELRDEPASVAAGALTGRGRKIADDVERRAKQRQLYRGPDPTRAFVEHDYWHRRVHDQGADMIPVNAFWNDFAEARGRRPFVSPHLALPTSSMAEMLLALAFLDLPFTAGEHVTASEGSRFRVQAGSPLLLVRKELAPAAPAAEETPLLVSQGLFRLDDPWVFEGGVRRDKLVTGELVAGVVYGCRVVVTNPTSAPQRLELLLQIPRGAIAVQSGLTTRGIDLVLDPFATRSVEYHFYFPAPGAFSHFPAHVARGGELAAAAPARELEVVAQPSTVDTSSWEHVSQAGTLDEVLALLEGSNLARLDLSRIAWRMADVEAFGRVLAVLRARHAFDATLWSYALRHGDIGPLREFVGTLDGLLQRCGPVLESPLVTIDPVARGLYEHVEYEPLFHARAHRFGRDDGILDASLAAQYGALLEVLARTPRLDDRDWMAVTYHMALQDRIGEARAAFARVDPDRLGMDLQYDYARAYLDVSSAEPALARSVAEPWRDHPVTRWRERFRDVLAQLDEAAGAAVVGGAPDDRTRQMTALADSAPSLELLVEGRAVTVRASHLARCEVNYYGMDVELLFSTNPFVQQGTGAFAYVKPNRSDVLELGGDAGETSFELPPEFHGKNVLVEARAAGLVRRQASFANTLAVRWMETYGQLEVEDGASGAPLPATYVKVYAETAGGAVRFHKDGYTDLRGRFDYVSVSSGDGQPAQRYAVLVLSETHGAVIREVTPPAR